MNKIVLILTLFFLTEPLMSQIVIAPELKEIGKYEQGRKAVYYEIYKILEKEKIDYHNFSSVVSDTLYFRDYLHLNENGIEQFSNIMADSLFANPILP